MSIIRNGYCTLAQFKAFITPPDQILNLDAEDDDVIRGLIETASRRVDAITGRQFYPQVETRSYDIPGSRTLLFDADLLAINSFTNGDGDAIASTEYILEPANAYPKYSLKLRNTSTVYWQTDTNSSGEQVIDLDGIWGFHEDYSRYAWVQGGTLAAPIATTAILTATLTAGHTLEALGLQILRIDNEIFNSVSVATNMLTVLSRGDNGSTAATHLNLAPVYVWQPMEDISELTLEIARIMYRSRYGENVETTSTFTPAGVIVTPRSLPVWAQEVIRKYQRLV